MAKKHKNTDKIDAFFITKTGNLVRKNNVAVEDNKIVYNEGTYIPNEKHRLLVKKLFGKREAYLWVEGHANSIDFMQLHKKKGLKIDPKSLNKLLKAKLLQSLFEDKATKTREIITMVLMVVLIIGIILSVIINLDVSSKLTELLRVAQENGGRIW